MISGVHDGIPTLHEHFSPSLDPKRTAVIRLEHSGPVVDVAPHALELLKVDRAAAVAIKERDHEAGHAFSHMKNTQEKRDTHRMVSMLKGAQLPFERQRWSSSASIWPLRLLKDADHG